MSRLTPVVKWLLIFNIGIFIVDYLILPLVLGLHVDDLHKPPIVSWGAFAIPSAIFEFRVWEFITFQFLHDNLLHVLFNCIGLFFFGPWMEKWWGSRKFLIFYLLCGCAGAAFFALLTALHLLPEIHVSLSMAKELGLVGQLADDGTLIIPRELIGASAGIYGIFIGVAVIAPDLRVMLLFPPIELSMRQLAIALLVISIGSILLKLGGNEGGEAGHLGGAILGFILMRYPGLLGRDSGVEIRHPRKPFVSKLRPRTRVELDQESAVDIILDKISRDGFQSLTDAEREVLQKAAGKKQSDK